MIHAVSAVNQHLYARQLDQMFRMRHAYYVEGHGWAGLRSKDGKETDEFDTAHAVYLMSLDPFGDVAASVRLNPTTGPTLLHKFADHSDEPLPRAESVWDISRWIAAPQHRRADNARWPSNHQRELIVGILEFCRRHSVSHLVMLAELRLAQRIAAYGWPLRYLGAPREYEGGKGVAVAAEFEAGPHVLALTRARTGVTQDVLIEIASAPVDAMGEQSAIYGFSELLMEIGLDRMQTIVEALASRILDGGAPDRPRQIELIAAFNRLIALAASLEVTGSALVDSRMGHEDLRQVSAPEPS